MPYGAESLVVRLDVALVLSLTVLRRQSRATFFRIIDGNAILLVLVGDR